MTQEEQIKFVESLCNATRSFIVCKIKHGKIPENWDGIELRRYITLKFKDNEVGTFKDKRKRDFNNTILVNDL